MTRLRAEKDAQALAQSGYHASMRVEEQVASLKAQQDHGRLHPAAADETDTLCSHAGGSCPLPTSLQPRTDLPMDADTDGGERYAGYARSHEQQTEQHGNAHAHWEQRYDQRLESAHVSQEPFNPTVGSTNIAPGGSKVTLESASTCPANRACKLLPEAFAWLPVASNRFWKRRSPVNSASRSNEISSSGFQSLLEAFRWLAVACSRFQSCGIACNRFE
jgi:hypothetical protein